MMKWLALILTCSTLQAADLTIACPGVPGPLCVFSKATPLVMAGYDVVVASAEYEKGRAVIFGHNGFFEAESLKVADTKAYLEARIRWTAKDAKTITVMTRGLPGFRKIFQANGITIEEATQNWNAVSDTVLLVNPAVVNPTEAKKIKEFVADGGGLIAGVPGWGWQQTSGGKALDRDLPLNLTLAAMGLCFAEGTIEKPKSGTLTVTAPSKLANTTLAMAALEKWLAGGDAPTSADAGVIQAAIANIRGVVPEEYAKPLNERLSKLLARAEKRLVVPTAKKPLREADAANRLLFRLSNQVMMHEPSQAHPAAAEFPGAVPKAAARSTVIVTVDISSKGYICNGVGTSANSEIWYGTGLYAAPGETITVIPPENAKNLGVRIGCHTDTLWNLKSWQRAPEISKRVPLTGRTEINNPFGGLIYLTAKPGIELGMVAVLIENAVAAPQFEAGRTTAMEWAKARKHQAPWTEFVGKNVILTLPSVTACAVDDPGEVLAFWDKVLDLDADLTCVSRERGRKERLVHDVQISAGYMHSGYPIMCPLNEGQRAVDLKRIQREGAWGYFHELGHNHQQKPWTFDGTVEVTCNLYSLYCFDKLCKDAPLHESIRPDAIQRHAKKYFAGGRKYETWKDEPFTALIMYKQLKDEFGWEAFSKAFAKYHELKLRPRGDAAERDEWLIQMSAATGKNLGPFFEHWGVPTSDAARKKVADLPAWQYPDASATRR